MKIFLIQLHSYSKLIFNKHTQFETETEADAYSLGVRDAMLSQGIEVTGRIVIETKTLTVNLT